MKTSKRALSREKRKLKIRRRISGDTLRPRASVFRSDKHIYAQLVDDSGGNAKTLVVSSTLEKDVIDRLKVVDSEGRTKSTKSVVAARIVGVVVAERAKKLGVTKVVFDRSGFVYAGRVKALADGLREGGLEL